MIKIERLHFRYIWSMMTRRKHKCWHLRTNKCVRSDICKKSVFVVSVRNINISGRILTQFTGLLRTNTVAAKRNILVERTGLGKLVSVSLRKNGPYSNIRGIFLIGYERDSSNHEADYHAKMSTSTAWLMTILEVKHTMVGIVATGSRRGPDLEPSITAKIASYTHGSLITQNCQWKYLLRSSASKILIRHHHQLLLQETAWPLIQSGGN